MAFKQIKLLVLRNVSNFGHLCVRTEAARETLSSHLNILDNLAKLYDITLLPPELLTMRE